MLKRILFTFFTLLVLYSVVLIGYRLFEPNTEEAYTPSHHVLDYETLNEYTLSSGNASYHYYLFSSDTSADCKYVKDTIIQTAALNTGVDVLDYIEEVDITPLEQEYQLNRLKEEWNVSSYPAFVACHNENNKIIIDNQLEWDNQHPISVDDFIDWMVQNRLYDIENPEIPIETPAS